jgi:MYXO-CTERM domain-containing protein
MNKSSILGALAAVAFALPILTAAPAHAGIGACGDIDVSAQGMCEVKVDGCDVSCSPFSVEAACAAQLEGSCAGSCPQVPSVSCTGTCEADCSADCMVTPAQFECSASCKADATAQCNAQCAADANQGQCTASCRATFAAECDASCTGKPGSASCTAKCQGRCQGSCTAQSKLKCQVDCQGKGYAACKTKVTGGCQADCADPKGALFCDGEYIDHEGTVDECIAALRAALPTITVDASAQGESSCTGSSCEASGQAQASTNCSFSPRATGHDWAGAGAALAALGMVWMRRRKAR